MPGNVLIWFDATGYSCSKVGRRLGIHHSNISGWVQQYRIPPENSGSLRDLEGENKRLKQESKRLRMEHEILKKAQMNG